MPEFGDLAIRLGAFIGIFAVMAVAEVVIPKRKLTLPRRQRWLTNFAIVVIDSVVVRAMAAFVIPIAAVAAAVVAERQGWGVLNQIDWPGWLEGLVAVVVLDFAIWLQHLAAHKIPLLWRMHRVHHADRDIDVTTALRFHPLEIALSMLWKIACVIALGASPEAVLVFEVILNALAMFNHSNIALPRSLDRWLRLAIVTPDVHRVHHSVSRHEHDSNYGFNLSIWDRMFRTYTAEPEGGHIAMRIGLAEYQTDEPARLGWSLMVPFLGKPSTDRSAASKFGQSGE